MINLRQLVKRARTIVKTEGITTLAFEIGRFIKTKIFRIFSNYTVTRGLYYRLFDTEAYWERRYSTGSNAGPGSTGQHAQFKANFINTFIEAQDIETVIEFGCGAGDQIRLGDYPEYIGLEVSESAVERCAERFDGDSTKSFFLYSPLHFVNRGALTADLALSLEVIFHILNDEEYKAYMHDLFTSGAQYVIIFSSNRDEATPEMHMRHRQFTGDVEAWFPEFELIQTRENEFPDRHSDFYVFERTGG